MDDHHSPNPYSSQAITEADNEAFGMDASEGLDVDIIPLLEKRQARVQVAGTSADGLVPSVSNTHSNASLTDIPASDESRSIKSPRKSALGLAIDTYQQPDHGQVRQDQVLRFQEQMKIDEIGSLKMEAYRDRVSLELEDLTATLFEEANNMVREEKIKRHHAEQTAAEANMKLEALQAETAWRRSQMSASSKSKVSPSKTASMHSQSYPPPFVDLNTKTPSGVLHWLRSLNHGVSDDVSVIPLSDAGETDNIHQKETDPIVHREFMQWREQPSLNRELPLIQRIYTQEIEPNFEFTNSILAAKVLKAVEDNTIVIEEGDKYKPFSRECSLSVAPRLCLYRMKVNDEDVWYPISTFTRNRIITVCDFVTYVRYIQQGLVHRGVHDTLHEIVRLRERMCQARLGVL